MGLQSFERGLENMVEGVFARAFRSSLRPIELGRRLIREMDDHRTLDVRGRTIVPNSFTFWLSHDDRLQFMEIEEALVRELADAAREYAREEGYGFMGPIEVGLDVDAKMKAGRFRLTSHLQEAAGGGGAGSLVLMNGHRIPLGNKVVVLGRLSDCDIVVSDPNASRRHAEVRPSGMAYVVVDLQSTNGTKVNGLPIEQHRLEDGDEITIGTTSVRFEAS
jgi:hypothetical protein